MNLLKAKRLIQVLIAVVLFFSWVDIVEAQQPARKEIDLDDFAQQLFATQKEDANFDDLYESLLQLYTHPLDLNLATRDLLGSLYILSEAQINSFVDYRKTNGRLLSIYELQAIPGFDIPTIQKLLPFVTVYDNGNASDTRSLWKRILTEHSNTLLLRYDQTLEKKKGFLPPDTARDGSLTQRYTGSAGHWYARYRINHPGDFSLGFTMEKDAGEQITWQPSRYQYGADFFSWHLLLENKRRWKKIAIGDYQLQIGQGLLLSAGFSVGKGASTVETIRRSQVGIRPYTSIMETGFLRGGAATYVLGKFEVTGFYSHTHRDANVNDSDSLTDSYISSLLLAGYHRTPHELTTRATVLEQTSGGDITYKSTTGRFEMGGTFIDTQYDTPIQKIPRRYNQFEFSGKNNIGIGLHYSYVWQNFNLFGEAARSSSGGLGAVSGILGSLSPHISAALLIRHYDRNFHTFYGGAFGENTRNINESGIYWGVKFNPTRRITLTAYYDSYHFSWLKYRVDAPSEGFDYLLRLAWQPTKKLLLYTQYREEHKQRNEPDQDSPINFITETIHKQYLFNIDFQANDYLFLRTRVQFSSFKQSTLTTGYAIMEDLTLKLRRWQASTRFALFDTDDYDNRQYAFEKDVLNSFSVPMYYLRGARYYLLLNYDVTPRCSVWFRVARTSLVNQDTMGSGLDRINGPQRTDIKVQVRYHL
ncbi:helix-hairpin-helix domain-containing protein [Cytophagaceae bacterium YF14B1]|uniref:Helix-hairpin-helix domain-containing protein n=1 Tax=Xanthocytophaga flava TaxID=3048013 RepID=A0AAE3QPG6_9BACT|nr:helix-hairpin-helix domain-containing protein [Xanthocytophaga flavus]MDJ1480489.1 helix-hairpin-helix domain-containing protein [Xanthocytophaga flavus]